MTTKFCVVGSPIEHSLSPVLHGAVYQKLGLDASYTRQEVKAGDLGKFLAENSFRGVSVTMPLKTEAFELAATWDGFAELTKNANTLVSKSEGWHAANTDVFGLIKALQNIPKIESISVIGSGATTSSALVAISTLFASASVKLLARNQDDLAKLLTFGEQLGLEIQTGLPDTGEIISSDLVLSLVPQGAYTKIWDEIKTSDLTPSGWLFDVSYNPWPSEAALSWESQKTISGIEMLIWQAVEQVRLFTDGLAGVNELGQQELYSLMRQAVSSK